MLVLLADITGVLAAALCLGLALASIPRLVHWVRGSWREAVFLTIAVALSLALIARLGAPGAPLGPTTVFEVAATGTGGWSGAWASLLHFAFAFPGVTDGTIFAANALLAALTAPALYLLARRLELSTLAAGLACLALATTGAQSRLALSDSAGPLQAVLLCLGMAAWARPNSRLDLVFAGVSIGLASTLTPEGSILLPLAAMLPFTRPESWQRQDWIPLGLALIAIPALILSAPEVAEHFSEFGIPDGRDRITSPPWGSALLPIGALLSMAATPTRARVRIWVLAFIVLASAVAYCGPGRGLAAVDQQLLTLPALALGAALGLELVLTQLRRIHWTLAAAAALGAAAITVPSLWSELQPTRDQQAHQSIASGLSDVPPDCAILYASTGGRDYQVPTRYSRGSSQRWIDLSSETQPYGGCQYYLRPWGCLENVEVDPEIDNPPPPPLLDSCRKVEATLEMTAVSTVGGAADNGSSEIGLFEVVPPIDPSLPVPSAPVPPRGPDDIARQRAELQQTIATSPPWTPPASWKLDALHEILEADPSCPVDEIRCVGSLCVALSTDPDCKRSAWHAATRKVAGADVSRFTWTDEADGFSASVVSLIPTASRDDREVQTQLNAMARLFLLDALYP